MTQYWVVGAMWEGTDDQSDTFIRRGCWFLGWTREQQPKMAALVDEIKPGDRIAIKKMLGQGSPNIMIRALGVVTEVDAEDSRVYVKWVVSGLERIVPGRGAFDSIRGPFEADDEWTRLVFEL